MSKPTVLICGAGIAGPLCCFFLNKAGIKTTIIERSSELRTAGQQIDLRGTGVQIVKRAGLYDVIKSKTVKEEGVNFVDKNSKVIASFPLQQDSKGTGGFTAEVEIIRSDLVQIFYDATKNDTEYIFGDHVTEISQDLEDTDSKVKVTLSSGTTREFDIVIGADGMGSKIRRLAFPNENFMKTLGQFTAFFTIPHKETDGPFARWFNTVKGRVVFIRPDGKGCSRAYMSIMSSIPREREYFKMSIPEQKALMRELFADVEWECPRVLDGMDTSEDFYMQEIAQVRMPSWSKGHVALLGDAGYCPSPISGMGTTTAVTGAYILAGEIAKHGMDIDGALKGYEERMRPFAKDAQNLPPGAPKWGNPQSALGVRILASIMWFVAWSGLVGWLSGFGSSGEEDKRLPLYEF